MTTNDRFDRELGAWLEQEASISAPVGLHAEAIERGRGVRQRPGWLVALRGGTIGSPARPLGRLDRRSTVVLAILGLLVVAMLAAYGAGAFRTDRGGVLPPVNGAITFMRGADNLNRDLYVACPDLTDERRIAREGRSEGWSTWSPDGTRLAFNANYDDPDLTDGTEIWDIYTMDPDGGNVVRLTSSTGLAGDPAWSPDGRRIVFDSTEPGRAGIWTMDAADGGNPTLVLPTPDPTYTDYAPRFSPDGRRIVFLREQANEAGALWVMDGDGTDLRSITPPDLHPNKPAWSPDGTRIVFDATSPADPRGGIWTVRPDGTDLTKLDLPAVEGGMRDGYADPVWSPDGTLILLVHQVHQGSTVLGGGLATVQPDGSGLRWVTDGTGYEQTPDWGIAGC